MRKGLNKERGILFSGLCTVLFFCMYFYAKTLKLYFCGTSSLLCWQMYNMIGLLLLIAPAVFIVSIVARYFLGDSFKQWRRVTITFLIVYILITLITPWDLGNGMAGPSLSKGIVALFLVAVYFLSSLVYIAILRNKKSF